MQIGIDSFAAFHDNTKEIVNSSERLRRLVEQIEYADKIGLDVFGVGEHHRKEFLDSAPAVILAAAAARTKRIRLTSAVTVMGRKGFEPSTPAMSRRYLNQARPPAHSSSKNHATVLQFT